MLHCYAIRALCLRQLSQFLGNPLGYIFIIGFTLACASFLFVPDTFFTRDICDLQALLPVMPWLLAILLPALSMTAWSSERELHTDESLLSLPITIADALLAKWLAISIYWTISLTATLSNVWILYMLGEPDLGLIACNYAGWALLGYILSAAALCASCLVSMPSVAFILGCMLCSACVACMKYMHWSSGFDRGVFNFSSVFSSIAAIVIFLSVAIIWISSARWQRARRRLLFKQLALCLLSVCFFINGARIAHRYASDIDLSSDQLSTLSPEAYLILNALDRPIDIHIFIQQDLPREWQQRGADVEHMLLNIQRAANNHITIYTHRPADNLDPAAELARRHYALHPQRVETSHVTGTEYSDIFLGAVLSNGSRKDRIPFFSQGLSIEYECIRAIASLSQDQRPVLGIVKNDFPLLGGYNRDRDRMEAEQKIITEWRKRYRIVELRLGQPVADFIDVLLVAMPSSLPQDELLNLNRYLWNGRPCLLFDDPAPMWSQIECAPAFTRAQVYTKADTDHDIHLRPKGDIDTLYRALGISFQRQQIAWSTYNPSNRLRAVWPKSIIWTDRRNGGMSNHPAMTGIDSLLFPFPGRLAAYPQEHVHLTSLVHSSANSAWGLHTLSDYITYDSNFGFRNHKPQQFTAEAHDRAILAVAAHGYMSSAYELTATTTQPAYAAGTRSPHQLNCIVVADVDCIHDQFYSLHNNNAASFHDDDLSLIRQLQNVQWSVNCLDVLLGDSSLLALRNRHLTQRNLSTIERIRMHKEAAKRRVKKNQHKKSQQQLVEIQAQLVADIAHIQEDPQLSAHNKTHRINILQHHHKIASEDVLLSMKRREENSLAEADSYYRHSLVAVFNRVRRYALGIPSIILGLLALGVFLLRGRRERLHIPATRLKKRQATDSDEGTTP